MLLIALAGLGAFVTGVIVLAYKRRWHWTGLPAHPGNKRRGQPSAPAKTLWDWLQLLIVPLVLAGVAFALNASQASRQQHQEDLRAQSDRRAQDRRALSDRLATRD